jgi:hypothetical protein
MINGQNDYQDTNGERSPMSALKKDPAGNKRSTSKFRSMDLTNPNLTKIGQIASENASKPGLSKYQEAPHPVDSKNQEVLSDLREASMEGGNSISLSPMRSHLPGIQAPPMNKI